MHKKIGVLVIALTVTTFATPLFAKGKPVLPTFDQLKNQFKPQGDKAWLLTGHFEWPDKITATSLAGDGRTLVVGDDSGFVGLFDLNRAAIRWRKKIYADGNTIKLVVPDPTGSQIAVLGASTQGAIPMHLVNFADGSATALGPEKSPSSVCAAVEAATLEPIQFAWSPDGATLYTLYQSYMQANRDGCMIATEIYLYLRNLNEGKVAIRNVVLDGFRFPEGDEPDDVWCMVPVPQMALAPDGKTAAVSFCNSRVVTYGVGGRKIKLGKNSKSLQRRLAKSGFEASHSGHLAFDRANNVYAALGSTGTLATTHLVRLSPRLDKVAAVARIGQPLPVIRLSPDERLLLLGRDTLDAWDLKSQMSLIHGPRGKFEAHLSQFHPKRRAILLVAGPRIHFLVERPRVALNLTSDWSKTGRFVFNRDSFFVSGAGDIGYGFGKWLREDWKDGEVWVNHGLSSQFPDDDVNEEGEIQLRTKTPGEFALYGGRTPEEGTTLKELLATLPSW